MIARALLLLPYPLYVPQGAQFEMFEWEERGYRISVPLPATVKDAPEPGIEIITINGLSARPARVLVIEFSRDAFDRRENLGPGEIDPPLEFVFTVANGFLRRLRMVTGAAHIGDLRPLNATGRIEYRRDDGSELAE